MKIIAFGASGSKHSINKEFAAFTARQFEGATVEVLDLNDYPLPLYNIDLEHEIGIPENVFAFYDKLKSADLTVVSFAEYNGSYTSFFKNLFDWLSRIEKNIFAQGKWLLLATAPGPRGGLSVLEAAMARFPRHGAEIIGHFSLPQFGQNFDAKNGFTAPVYAEAFGQLLEKASEALSVEAKR